MYSIYEIMNDPNFINQKYARLFFGLDRRYVKSKPGYYCINNSTPIHSDDLYRNPNFQIGSVIDHFASFHGIDGQVESFPMNQDNFPIHSEYNEHRLMGGCCSIPTIIISFPMHYQKQILSILFFDPISDEDIPRIVDFIKILSRIERKARNEGDLKKSRPEFKEKLPMVASKINGDGLNGRNEND